MKFERIICKASLTKPNSKWIQNIEANWMKLSMFMNDDIYSYVFLSHEILEAKSEGTNEYIPIICNLVWRPFFDLKFIRVFYILQRPVSIENLNNFYILIAQKFTFDASGSPVDKLMFEIKVEYPVDFVIHQNKYLKYFLIPYVSMLRMIRISISASLDVSNLPYTSKMLHYTRTYIHSVRVVKKFNWTPKSQNEAHSGQNFKCHIESESLIKMRIFKMYGPSLKSEISLNSFQSDLLSKGYYKFVCIVQLFAYKFIRTLSIYKSQFTNLYCFLPFIPTRGNIIKCNSDSYPRHYSDFAMTIVNIRYGKLVASAKGDTIMIPFSINAYEKMEIICKITDHDFFNSTQYIKITRLIFKLQVITSMNINKTETNCLQLYLIPKEYDITINKYSITIWSSNFYLISRNSVNNFKIFIPLSIMYLLIFLWIRLQYDYQNVLGREYLQNLSLIFNINRIRVCIINHKGHYRRLYLNAFVMVHPTYGMFGFLSDDSAQEYVKKYANQLEPMRHVNGCEIHKLKERKLKHQVSFLFPSHHKNWSSIKSNEYV